jgi:hypothetical protein
MSFSESENELLRLGNEIKRLENEIQRLKSLDPTTRCNRDLTTTDSDSEIEAEEMRLKQLLAAQIQLGESLAQEKVHAEKQIAQWKSNIALLQGQDGGNYSGGRGGGSGSQMHANNQSGGNYGSQSRGGGSGSQTHANNQSGGGGGNYGSQSRGGGYGSQFNNQWGGGGNYGGSQSRVSYGGGYSGW